MKNFKILMLGDVVGPLAVDYVTSKLWGYRRENEIDFVVANGENSAKGNGISRESADAMLSGGVDVITTGNHVFKKFEAPSLLEENKNVLRPANYPDEVSGRGYIIQNINGYLVLTINLLGVIMLDPLENPFRAIDRILSENAGKYDFTVVDFHAEATSEKLAMAYYTDGRLTVFAGTHTHVTTADETIFPGGTAYITDIGMCGPKNSVLGISPECIIEKLKLGVPVKFTVPENEIEAHGILVEADPATKKAVSIKRILL